ncbi:unnamed protein product [Lactuca virosa]|uniref:t-SNARE coiled-coil homology domain-containing protein n=1 Tax=Lactuca virosa TaxID=75947 RepID=A0AAU9P4K3_9ASTR|nr:unnamed protein product [Lactuca virosa]
MPSQSSPNHSWSPNYSRQMAENVSNGVTHEDMAINLLHTQLELSLVREEIANNIREIRRSITRDLDALNHEVDDVRAGQLDLSNMVADLKNHLCSLQASYVNIVLGKNKCTKVKWVVGDFCCRCCGVLTYKFLKCLKNFRLQHFCRRFVFFMMYIWFIVLISKAFCFLCFCFWW